VTNEFVVINLTSFDRNRKGALISSNNISKISASTTGFITTVKAKYISLFETICKILPSNGAFGASKLPGAPGREATNNCRVDWDSKTATTKLQILFCRCTHIPSVGVGGINLLDTASAANKSGTVRSHQVAHRLGRDG
jgi:hypothetical protein